jgi:8-oxo-dGTP pyrophosphatase MutT (NUDIX family)
MVSVPPPVLTPVTPWPGQEVSGEEVSGEEVSGEEVSGEEVRGQRMSRVEYWNDPAAPPPNSLVPACGVLAVDERGRVLVQRRRDTGQWALPMGKMELGETPSQCAIRETREETGIVVHVTGLLGVFSDPGHIVAYGDGEIRQEYEVILLARPLSGSLAPNDEASDVRWAAPGELSELDIHPTQWRQLNCYFDGAYPHID